MDGSENNALIDPVANVNSCLVELINQPSPQRIRIMIEPSNGQLHNHVIFKNPRFSEISLSALESKNYIENNLNFKYIDLQVL